MVVLFFILIIPSAAVRSPSHPSGYVTKKKRNVLILGPALNLKLNIKLSTYKFYPPAQCFLKYE